MLYRKIGFAMALTVASIGVAQAGYVANDGAGTWLDIRSDEPESDKLLGLGCGAPGLVDVHLGGEFGIGKGGHEAVSVKLSAGKQSAEVKGLSIATADSEMTGGIELLTALAPGDKAFGILTSGRELGLQHDGKSEKFTLGKAATDALKAFLKGCDG